MGYWNSQRIIQGWLQRQGFNMSDDKNDEILKIPISDLEDSLRWLIRSSLGSTVNVNAEAARLVKMSKEEAIEYIKAKVEANAKVLVEEARKNEQKN